MYVSISKCHQTISYVYDLFYDYSSHANIKEAINKYPKGEQIPFLYHIKQVRLKPLQIHLAYNNTNYVCALSQVSRF